MKRALILICFLVLFAALARAQDNPGDVAGVLSKEFNIPKDKIPTDPEQLKQEYLKLQWTNLIENTTVAGPIHKFLSNEKTQYFFQVIFSHKYELSVEFVLIFILWILVLVRSTAIIEEWRGINGFEAFALGMCAAILIAWLQFYNIIVKFTLELIFKPENIWTRIILSVVAFGVFVLIYAVSKIMEKNLAKKKEANTQAQLKHELEKTKTLNKATLGK